ncbi:response regulator [Azospirillum picis]|uniref:DNA-binding response OmpR family regulator n=1 Tax=Azospirillum picis TaxID=488438 RepID=A0ABU0MHC0_9PROT|nr:response regulator [Azospirillum picis]MBP2298926.1 DNA-binding response OmpR family regulator [Azospirillum picis]MDQ0532832.1 DNA-binding response OmpR family regulator [Azospirillum picis]
MRILIVDDAEHVRYSLRTSLEDAGHEVEEAADGEEALAKLRSGAVDLVVADVWMPRLNGIDLLQRLRTVSPEIPVFVITGGAARIPIESTAAMARTWGADQVFYKPFDNEDLVAAIRQRSTRPDGDG